MDFFETIGKSGIVLNPDKFKFVMKEADFAGFCITNSAIGPLPKFVDGIKGFPTPMSMTDIRSWFGRVNQVSNYAQLRVHFNPFFNPMQKFI